MLASFVRLGLATLIWMAGASVQADPANAARPTLPPPYQVGKAAWYGEDYDGRETANGETYNMYRLTAAHRDLPLGAVVKVTNLRNGRKVTVRINDRGPVKKHGRIIDLSYAASRRLGMAVCGVAPVRINVLKLPAEG